MTHGLTDGTDALRKALNLTGFARDDTDAQRAAVALAKLLAADGFAVVKQPADEPLMVPMVHMNGDSKGTLMSQCEDAHRAATALIDALGEMSPNGRNFYTRGPDAILVALRQNVARVAKVMSVKTEIEAIWEAINEQNGR